MRDDIRRVWEHLHAMQRPKTIAERRAVYDALFADFALASDIRVEPESGPGFRGEWLSPPDAEDGRVLLYMHGGGYVRGLCAATATWLGRLRAQRVVACSISIIVSRPNIHSRPQSRIRLRPTGISSRSEFPRVA